MEYQIDRENISTKKLVSIEEIIFYKSIVTIKFTEVDFLQLKRISDGRDYINIPYCYANHRYYKRGEKRILNIINNDSFLEHIQSTLSYEATCYTDSELDREEWIKGTVHKIKLLNQLINQIQKAEGEQLSPLLEVLS